MLLDAFRHFKAAKELGDELRRCRDLASPEARRLQAGREQEVTAANLRLGMQEQWVTLQQPRTFDDPVVAEVVKALTPSMTLTDATGTHPLLRHGGNWADFADRMGFVELKVDAPAKAGGRPTYTLTDAQGVAHHFMINPDRQAREGSIFAYFTENSGARQGKKLREHDPRPFDRSSEGLGQAAKGLWHGLTRLVKPGD
jgi:hypothetical protein